VEDYHKKFEDDVRSGKYCDSGNLEVKIYPENQKAYSFEYKTGSVLGSKRKFEMKFRVLSFHDEEQIYEAFSDLSVYSYSHYEVLRMIHILAYCLLEMVDLESGEIIYSSHTGDLAFYNGDLAVYLNALRKIDKLMIRDIFQGYMTFENEVKNFVEDI
jgi:hypothetical protein